MLASDLIKLLRLTLLLLFVSSGGTLCAQSGRASDILRDPAARASWEQLLYFAPRWFHSTDSLVDSPGFFLSARGQTNPVAELDALLTRLSAGEQDLSEVERASCRFPARILWLQRHAPDFFKGLALAPCERYQDWLLLSQPKAVSLVFSSYYLNNPSSMMGHTFLRLHKKREEAPPLLDKAVNFAATPTTEAPVLYTLMGLTGHFPGRFSMTPYYSKVQEYANAESRDLWEYRLSFDETETLRMMASLWELAPEDIDYYFFDENCSAILIFLLQTAREGLRLSDELGAFTHPSDTLRILMAEPGLVADIEFRPSTRSRYLAQREALTETDRELLDRQLKSGALSEELKSLPAERQVQLLDTGLAGVEFLEGLYGSQKPVRFSAFYDASLAARSKLPPSQKFEYQPPPTEAPHLGHRGQRWGLGLGSWENEPFFNLEYRPGQHDLASPSYGFPPELSIELGRSSLTVSEEKGVELRRAELFRILSLNPTRSGELPWSWQLALGYEGLSDKNVQLTGGIGQAWTLGARPQIFFAMVEGGPRIERGELWGCFGASLGLRLEAASQLVSVSRVRTERCASMQSSRVHDFQLLGSSELRLAMAESWELYVSGEQLTRAKEWSGGVYRYF